MACLLIYRYYENNILCYIYRYVRVYIIYTYITVYIHTILCLQTRDLLQATWAVLKTLLDFVKITWSFAMIFREPFATWVLAFASSNHSKVAFASFRGEYRENKCITARDTENTRKGTFLEKRYLFGLGLIFLGLDQKSWFWCILGVLSQKLLVFAGAILCSNAVLSLCCFWCVWRPAQGFLLSFFMIFYKRKSWVVALIFQKFSSGKG